MREHIANVFFPRYNTVNRHSGIGYMAPHAVHHGHADALLITRQASNRYLVNRLRWNFPTVFVPLPFAQ
jgi:hypothetical protein